MFSYISKIASGKGYTLFLNNALTGEKNHIIDKPEKICNQLIEMQVKAAFYFPVLQKENNNVNQTIVSLLSEAGINVVLLDRDIYRSPERSNYDLIKVNHTSGSFKITRHLINTGCKKLSFVGPLNGSSSEYERIDGFKKALGFNGLSYSKKIVHNIYPEDQEEIDDFVCKTNSDGIVCINDEMAALIIKSCVRQGIKIPDDIKIVGFDDLSMLNFLPVRLTTIRQPVETLAREAVRVALERVNNQKIPAREIIVSGELIIRDSCGFNK